VTVGKTITQAAIRTTQNLYRPPLLPDRLFVRDVAEVVILAVLHAGSIPLQE
jgi:hypothetical protein